MFQRGYKTSDIAKAISKSKSTVYKYIQEEYDLHRYPEIRTEIKVVLFQGDFEKYILNLSFRDISLIRRKLSLGGTSKQEKIHAILKYFKSNSILGVYPEYLSKAIIKSANRRKAEETHQSYEDLLRLHA